MTIVEARSAWLSANEAYWAHMDNCGKCRSGRGNCAPGFWLWHAEAVAHREYRTVYGKVDSNG